MCQADKRNQALKERREDRYINYVDHAHLLLKISLRFTGGMI